MSERRTVYAAVMKVLLPLQRLAGIEHRAAPPVPTVVTVR